MAKDSSKKRRSGDDGPRPKKAKTADGVKISIPFEKPPVAAPVVAVTPGITISREAEFICYDKTESKPKKGKQDAPYTEMLLRSRGHRAMDYTGREDPSSSGPRSGIRHFIGIHDPKTGELQLVEARKMVIRGTARAQQPPDDSMKRKKTMFEMRTELGEAFGTKKAKKALKSVVENAIEDSGTPGRMAGHDLGLMEGMSKAAENMTTKEEMNAAAGQARTVPYGNYDAEKIQDVYIPEEIIGSEIFHSIPVMDWQEKVKAGEAIHVPSRYVANRVTRVVHGPNSVEKLRVLRYLLLVIMFWSSVRPGKERGTKMLPKRPEMRTIFADSGVPDAVVENIRRKFSDAGVMRKAHVDLLMTHCAVLACIVDSYEVNFNDLKDDLKQEPRPMTQYFMEIGARYRPKKTNGKTDYIAKLALPLQFPEVRGARRGGRR